MELLVYKRMALWRSGFLWCWWDCDKDRELIRGIEWADVIVTC